MRPKNRASLIGILFKISIAVRNYGCGGTSKRKTGYEIKKSHVAQGLLLTRVQAPLGADNSCHRSGRSRFGGSENFQTEERHETDPHKLSADSSVSRPGSNRPSQHHMVLGWPERE